jgi:LysM repeat protein
LLVGVPVILLAGIPVLAGTAVGGNPLANGSPDDGLARLAGRAAELWGPDNAWIPTPTVLVQYETDLGERTAVDFENGVVHVQILLSADDDPTRERVVAHLRQGLGNLVQGDARDPVEMLRAQEEESQPVARKKGDETPKVPPPGKEVRVYLVRQGDSLQKIARRFHMKTAELVQLNDLDPDEILQAGRPLKVQVFVSHDLIMDPAPRPPGRDPLLLDQIRMVDGRPVSPSLVRQFAAEVVGDKPHAAKVVGADGVERLAVTATFKLVSNHVEIRARKFHPLVQRHAKKHGLDPALIMAIIHTESVFNPQARSSASAYGLMQLVPHAAAQEAYHALYGETREMTAEYLYDPANNIELGTAYFNILEDRYMAEIRDPLSRTYCAVGAYNGGAANVGRAFASKKSITHAAARINSLKPTEVYARLVEALPFRESRNYVRKVFDRVPLYREWL